MDSESIVLPIELSENAYFYFVLAVGVEPTIHYWRWVLRPERIPIPPREHVK